MAASDIPNAVPISPGIHAAPIRGAVEACGKSAWCYYVPFLCCYSLRPAREVHVLDSGDTLCLLVVRNGDRGKGVDLMVPPLPLEAEVLRDVVDLLRPLNGGQAPRILWADQADADVLERQGYQVSPKEREYIYSPQRIMSAEGREYRDLRKRLRRFERAHAQARFRDLDVADTEACHVLLKHWRRRQGRKHPFLLDWGYTRAALDRYVEFDREDLRGWCVEVEGRVAAFAMAGPIREGLANFFVAKADPDVPWLSDYLRREVFRELSDFEQVNDAGDLDLPGLRQHKAKFRPVDEIPVYTARAGDKEAP